MWHLQCSSSGSFRLVTFEEVVYSGITIECEYVINALVSRAISHAYGVTVDRFGKCSGS